MVRKRALGERWAIWTAVCGFTMLSKLAYGQVISPGPAVPTSLSHELFLVLVGAVLGGFLGPLLTMLDARIGISPGARQQKANDAVQREIAANLRALVSLQESSMRKDTS